jgi:polysaccharide biosynthesis transport protein
LLKMANELQFRDVIAGLMWRRRMIFGVALGGTLLILFAALLIPARYTATAQIVLSPTAAAGATPQLNEQIILTKVTEFGAEALLRRAADNLSRDPAYQAAEGAVGRNRRTPGDFLRSALRSLLPGWMSPWHTVKACRRLWVAELRKHLKVEQEAGSQVIAVHYTSTDPDLSALIANRITELYLKSQTEERQATAARSLAWLDKRIPATKLQLENAESAIRAYRSAHGLGDMNPTTASDQRFAELDRQLAVAEAGLAVDKARVASMRSGPDGAIMTPGLDAPSLDALRARETALLQEQATLGVSLGDNHPQMLQMQSALDEVRRKIGRETARAEAGLREQARVQASQVRMLRERIATIQDASGDVRLGELDSHARVDRQLYDEMLRRQEGTLEQLQTASSGFEMVSSAVPPDEPSTPNPLLFGPPALVFLLASSGFLAAVMERLNGTIRSEAELGAALGIPCIGFVPRVRKRNRGRPHQNLLRDTYGPYVEAVRSIVAGLLLATPDRAQVVLVTSSVPGEGKTTLAVSLATYAARIGRRTILLDLDFRHPATAREVGRWLDDRTLERLLEDRPVSDTVQRIPALRLDYVPMGHHPGDPLRLFAGDQIARLLERLRSQYDCIVVDTAPVLAITESRILAAMADRVLLAVKWDSTDRKVARNALDLLRRAGVRMEPQDSVVAGVLTQMDLRRRARVHDGSMADALTRYTQYYGQPAAQDRS